MLNNRKLSDCDNRENGSGNFKIQKAPLLPGLSVIIVLKKLLRHNHRIDDVDNSISLKNIAYRYH